MALAAGEWWAIMEVLSPISEEELVGNTVGRRISMPHIPEVHEAVEPKQDTGSCCAHQVPTRITCACQFSEVAPHLILQGCV